MIYSGAASQACLSSNYLSVYQTLYTRPCALLGLLQGLANATYVGRYVDRPCHLHLEGILGMHAQSTLYMNRSVD